MARKKSKVIPFRQETKMVYNRYKPNRKARRSGIKPEEPPKREEKKTLSRAAVLGKSIQRAKELQKQIVPKGMTYGEYMAYLKEKRQQLEEKKRISHKGYRVGNNRCRNRQTQKQGCP